MKIGVVGTGIGGLTIAWLFGREGHQVVLFDQNGTGFGRDAHSSTTAMGGEKVDVPLRLLSPLQWPKLFEICRQLGVDLGQVDASQSFSVAGSKVLFRVEPAGMFRRNWLSLLRSAANRSLRELNRLKNIGGSDLATGVCSGSTFAEYLKSRNFSEEFQRRFLYPALCTTVCTCSEAALGQYPAEIILDCLDKLTGYRTGAPVQLYKARYGVSDIARRLLRFEPLIKPSCKVISIKHRGADVELVSEPTNTGSGSDSAVERFDQVVVATQANQAGILLGPSLSRSASFDLELEMLGSFNYENVNVVLHTDAKLMPRDRRSWSAFNMISAPPAPAASRSMCSVWINKLDSSFQSEQDVFQTIMPIIEPDPAKIISACQLQRPIVNRNSFRGWAQWEQLTRQPDRRIWFVGSYACSGVPLLETAVVSALKVAAAIGIKTPLETSPLPLR